MGVGKWSGSLSFFALSYLPNKNCVTSGGTDSSMKVYLTQMNLFLTATHSSCMGCQLCVKYTFVVRDDLLKPKSQVNSKQLVFHKEI